MKKHQDITRTHRWLFAPLTLGCGGYSKVSPQAYQYSKALYSVCNRHDEPRLSTVSAQIEAAHGESELTAEELGLAQQHCCDRPVRRLAGGVARCPAADGSAGRRPLVARHWMTIRPSRMATCVSSTILWMSSFFMSRDLWLSIVLSASAKPLGTAAHRAAACQQLHHLQLPRRKQRQRARIPMSLAVADRLRPA